MIQTIDLGDRKVNVSEMTDAQQGIVSVLEKLQAEANELQYSMSKVQALAGALQSQLLRELQTEVQTEVQEDSQEKFASLDAPVGALNS